jgi:hypothetical protein
MARLTVYDFLAAKGQRKLIQMNVDGPDQARAAVAAGVDIIVNGEAARWPAIRAAAPDTHLCLSLRYGDHASGTDSFVPPSMPWRWGPTRSTARCPLR